VHKGQNIVFGDPESGGGVQPACGPEGNRGAGKLHLPLLPELVELNKVCLLVCEDRTTDVNWGWFFQKNYCLIDTFL
jgi:hypothetical protein